MWVSSWLENPAGSFPDITYAELCHVRNAIQSFVVCLAHKADWDASAEVHTGSRATTVLWEYLKWQEHYDFQEICFSSWALCSSAVKWGVFQITLVE